MTTRPQLPPFRTVEALAAAMHVGPSLIRESRVFGGVCVCAWDTPWLDGFALPDTDELILAYHSRGSHDVRRMRTAGMSRARSIPGLLTLIPPGQPVAYHTGGAVSFTSIHISRAALGEFGHAGSDWLLRDRFAFRDPFVASCMDSLLGEARLPDRWTPRFVSAVTEALVLHLLRQGPIETVAPEGKSPAQTVAEARARIDAGLADHLSVTRLAEYAGLSRAHFARVFRQVANAAPHRYIMQRRIDRAAELLRETDLELKAIAQDTGFCSQAHMTHLFTKRVGKTPLEYRRRSRDRPGGSL